MTECAKLNTLLSNQDIVTTENASQLRLSTYTRTPGTQVTLSCIDGYSLIGQSTVTCQPNGSWNYGESPYCKSNSSDGLSTDMKILIGCLVGGLILLVLLIILIAYCCRRRRKKSLSDQEKFYKQLKEEGAPKGQTPGEMSSETSYRPPSYAAAWPALTHSFMVGKKKFPFRSPEPETEDSSFRKGSSLWDNNDYFFNKADITSSRNESKTSENLIRFSDSEQSSAHLRNDRKQEIDPYRPSSISSQVENGYSQMVHPISNRYSLQREISQVVKHNHNHDFQDNRHTIISTNGDRRFGSSDDDVVVEVRIPARYLKQQNQPDYRPENSFENDTTMGRKTPYIEDVTPYVHKTRSHKSQDSGKPSSSKDKADKDVYQGYWPVRDEIKNLNEFNKKALLHNRDPFLWRPVDTNFGFEAKTDSRF